MKKTIRKLPHLIFIIVLCLSFSACSNTIEEGEAIMTASWEYAYSGFEELFDKADAVAAIKVISHNQKEENEGTTTLLMTYYDAEAKDIIKGTLPDKIVIPMTGGVSRGKVIQIVDDPLMKDGESYLVFVSLNPKGTYTILGGPQGRYTVKDGKVYSLDKHFKAVNLHDSLMVDGIEYETFKNELINKSAL